MYIRAVAVSLFTWRKCIKIHFSLQILFWSKTKVGKKKKFVHANMTNGYGMLQNPNTNLTGAQINIINTYVYYISLCVCVCVYKIQ